MIELAGLGALPFGTLKLADMGADVIRVERAAEVPAEPTPPVQRMGPGPSLDRGRPQAPRRGRGRAPARRARRRAGRVVPAGSGRASRRGSRGGDGPQPAAGLRAPHRLGPGRSRSRRAPATRSTTSRSPVRSARWAGRWSAGAPAPGAGRLRRRRPPPRVRRGLRAVRGATLGAGPGRRRGDGRRRGVDLLRVLRHGALGHAHRGDRHQPVRRRRALLQRVRDRRSPVRDAGADRAALLRRSSSSSGSTPPICRPSTTGRTGRR